MMRYQRLSPDCIPVPTATTGRKPDLTHPHPNPTPASGSPNPTHGGRLSGGSPTSDSGKRGGKPTSDAAPSTSSHGEINGGGDLLLQWGHNKRTRGPRTTTATAAAEESASHLRSAKIQRRSSAAAAEKLMPPPQQQLPVGSYTRGANLRSATSLPNHHRAVEEHHHRSRGGEKKNNHHHHKSNGHHHPEAADVKHHHQPSDHHHDLIMAASNGNEKAAALEHFEWPRIYISLSRKEKEDDFLAMKGTKLPQRPKKRAKNVDKTLQYVFPGMWLSDLTKGRYEVREKKCVKKKRRGLKGMESMDSDSE